MHNDRSINYLEFPAKDIPQTKRFFSEVFDWTFEDYGPEYVAFSNAGIDGGFFNSDLAMSQQNGSALVVFYGADLAATQAKVQEAGGEILKPIYNFPGGKRFHFSDPSGNEFAVWSDR